MGIRTDQSLDEAAQSARIADLLQNEGYTMTYLTDLDKRVEDLRLEVEHEWLKLDKAQRAEVSDLRANFLRMTVPVDQRTPLVRGCVLKVVFQSD